MRRPAALYDIRHLLTAQLPQLSGRLRAVLALWVEGTRLGWNGCQDTVTLALAQEPRVLAVDPTSKQDDLVALVISGVYRQHTIPVAWHIVRAQAKGSWIDHFCRLLRRLAPAVPVHVLCDQGLGSRDPWAQIVALVLQL